MRPPDTGPKAERADSLATRLVTAQAALTGKLADPTDLPCTHREAARRRRPRRRGQSERGGRGAAEPQAHLASRRPAGDVGQGARPEVQGEGLAALLRRGA